MNEKKIQICSEIYCLLNYFPESYICKIPTELLDLLKQNSDEKYFIEVDVDKNFEEQKIIEETKNTLVVLKYNYWSDENEKRNIIKRLSENEKKYEKELRVKFNPDNIFKTKTNEVSTDNTSNEIKDDKIMIIEEKWYLKIFNIIKKIFKRN